MTRSEFDPVDLTVTLPTEFVSDWGAKLTVSFMVCEGPRINGVAISLTLNPRPATNSCEIVILVPPALLIVHDIKEEVPRVIFPKLRLAAVVVSTPRITAVPDKGSVNKGFEALEVIVTVPLAFPAN